MYVDTDVVLAGLTVDDWLSDAVDAASIADPKTSVVTAVEVQLVMFEAWSRATSRPSRGISKTRGSNSSR